jgi:hypothetical protein
MAAPRRRTSSHGNPERPNNNQTPLPVAHHHSGGFWRGRQRAPGARFLDRRATVWAKVPASITVVNDEWIDAEVRGSGVLSESSERSPGGLEGTRRDHSLPPESATIAPQCAELQSWIDAGFPFNTSPLALSR